MILNWRVWPVWSLMKEPDDYYSHLSVNLGSLKALQLCSFWNKSANNLYCTPTIGLQLMSCLLPPLNPRLKFSCGLNFLILNFIYTCQHWVTGTRCHTVQILTITSTSFDSIINSKTYEIYKAQLHTLFHLNSLQPCLLGHMHFLSSF